MQEIENEKTEFLTLGLNQIITKTLLIIFGIFIVLRIFDSFVMAYMFASKNVIPPEQFKHIISVVMYYGALTAVLACVLYFFIINNNWLINKIIPNEEPVKNPELWLVVLLRAVLVLTGLVLISTNLDTIIIAAKFIIHLPSALREMITNAIQGNKVFDPVHTTEIYKLITAILSIYLIAGCPGFVKWQVNKILKPETNNE